GYGENMRVLKWIVDRVNNKVEAVESPFGYMPKQQDLTWTGLDFSSDTFYKLMSVHRDTAMAEANEQRQHFDTFGARLPKEMEDQRQKFIARLNAAPVVWELPR
ncbi:MAG: phosphoenolpyruvate carboxykinase (GTP), partial [Alphaproteobacteria bacterium]|nr:phosphoenolpyruvate carboxykinase (GTP) [Alphaproteobacteria bacterium]